MVLLRGIREQLFRSLYESNHEAIDSEVSYVVDRLIEDFEKHRDAVGTYVAPKGNGGSGVGGDPQPSG